MVSQIFRSIDRAPAIVRLKEQRQEAWWSASVLAGFVATFVMTVVLSAAYALAASIGQADGPRLLNWVWALSHAAPAQMATAAWTWALALHLSLGLIWALLYGGIAEPALRRAGSSGWRSGAFFALGPWILSVTLFLPLAGAGFLGTGVGAGPLPLLGNLALHLVYGAVLGAFYALARDQGLDEDSIDDASAALGAERGAAVGILGGLVTGAILGWVLSTTLGLSAGPVPIVVAGAFTGTALGALLGSLVGMGRAGVGRSTPVDGASSLADRHPRRHTGPSPLRIRSGRAGG
jgi:succinate dehydrogenase/fumarate reductase cytochrome b subunit